MTGTTYVHTPANPTGEEKKGKETQKNKKETNTEKMN